MAFIQRLSCSIQVWVYIYIYISLIPVIARAEHFYFNIFSSSIKKYWFSLRHPPYLLCSCFSPSKPVCPGPMLTVLLPSPSMCPFLSHVKVFYYSLSTLPSSINLMIQTQHHLTHRQLSVLAHINVTLILHMRQNNLFLSFWAWLFLHIVISCSMHFPYLSVTKFLFPYVFSFSIY